MRIPLLLVVVLLVMFAHLNVGQDNSRSDAPVFRDIAPSSNFRYVTDNDFRGRKYFPQPLCGGVAILDADGDGRLDVFFTNGARFPEMIKSRPAFHNCLLRSKGNGVFEEITARAGLTGAADGYGFGTAVGDYDNDGDPDLFVCNAGRNKLYRNTGKGVFEDVTAASGAGTKPDGVLSVAAAFFDYDRDGWLDLVIADYVRWNGEADRRCTRDGVDYYCPPRMYDAVPPRLYRNLRDGRFEDVTGPSGFGRSLGKGMGISIADYNGDGWLDVFIANDTERNFLFMNRRDGTFAESGLNLAVAYNADGITVSGMGSDARDYDNDGAPDIFHNALIGQTWTLFRNAREKGFDDVSGPTRFAQLSRPYSGWSGGFIDYDNDGWKDVYSANGNIDDLLPNARQHDTMFRNTGGAFRDVSAQLGRDFLRAGFQRGSAFADLNSDGAMDIVVTSLNERPRILMNAPRSGHHWLLLELIGSRSGRDAIGTAVRLTTSEGRTLYNHVAPSVGLMSSSDRRVHFGLGPNAAPVDLEIQWPAGSKQTVRGVKVDRVVAITEPGHSTP